MPMILPSRPAAACIASAHVPQAVEILLLPHDLLSNQICHQYGNFHIPVLNMHA